MAKLPSDSPKNFMDMAVESPSIGRQPSVQFMEASSDASDTPSLIKSILNILNGPNDSVERLAFEVDPSINIAEAGVYRSKHRLLPDNILKRISMQDDLVAAITQARANQMSAFGRPRPDRHSTGFVLEPKFGVADKFDESQQQEFDRRVDRAVELINSCGKTKGWSDQERLTFSQWLYISARNAVVVGRIATEIIQVYGEDGEKQFHSFRPIDAGTIYRAVPQKSAAEAVRKQAKALLEQVQNEKLVPEKFQNDEYAYIQVIEGRPVQAFTPEECLVHNFYPVADVELGGYPLTPLDTVISAVTTHINITQHNKLYFQSGRASRGMIVITSDEATPETVTQIKHQFNASINSVSNSWRMPVFSVAPGETLQWTPIDTGGRDAEFQYLTDMNARVILSAFQMAPEELPGWSYLSSGTNNQALSESSSEYKLEAARDLGIRPLISQFEDFLNQRILPLIDPMLAKLAVIKLTGLDAETAEKESVRLGQDMKLHMDYDEVRQKVEKKPIGKEWGGEFPLNPDFQNVINTYLTMGQTLEKFFGIEGASKNPELQYYRDSFWFENQNLLLQKQQLQMQMQQMQQQQAMAQQQAAMGGDPNAQGADQTPGNGDNQSDAPPDQEVQGGFGAMTEKQKSEAISDATGSAEGDLTRSIDQAIDLLTKSEKQLPPSRRRLLAQRNKTVSDFMKAWEEESAGIIQDIVTEAKKHKPKAKG